MHHRPFVSLCVIHRRAGAELSRLVDSVRFEDRFHFDELVFVDTGPDDVDPQSKAARRLISGLAAKHGEEVVVVGSWKDEQELELDSGDRVITDFAAAREHAHGLAHGVWTAFLDADDEFDCGSGRFSDQIREVFLPSSPGAVALWAEYEYSDELYQPRTFCWLEQAGWVWWGRLHEERVRAIGGEVAPFGPVAKITHMGQVNLSEDRNISILQALQARGEELSPKLLVALAGGLVERAQVREAVELLEKARRRGSGSVWYKATLLLAEIARRNGDVDRCRQLLGAATVSRPTWRTAFIELGLLEEAAGNLDEARRHFDRAYNDPGTAESPMATDRVREELAGRLSAARVEGALGNLRAAQRRLDAIPNEFHAHPAKAGMELEVRRMDGDRQLIAAIETTVRYLLAQDEVDRAADYLETIPHRARSFGVYREAVNLVRARTEHLANPDGYELVYSPVREADLAGGSRRQEDQVEAVRRAIRRLGDLERCYVLEVGCGTGWVLSEIHKRVALKARCAGFDVGARRVAVARERYGEGRNIRFEVGSVEDEDFVARAMQALDGAAPHVVLMAEVLEHVACPEDVLGKLRRLLAPGGFLLLTTPDAERYSMLRPTSQLLDLESAVYSKDVEHVRLYDCHRLVGELEDAGFDVAEVRPTNADLIDDTLLFAAARPRERAVVAPGPARQLRGRLDIYAPSPLPWGPRAHLEGFVGGSEQAVAHLAPLLAERGWDVHVFASVLDREHWYRGVFWHHLERFDLLSARDVLVVWRDVGALSRFADAGAPCALWAHDVPDKVRAPLYDRARTILTLSPYHNQLFSEIVSDHVRLEIIGNGVASEVLPALPEAAAELGSDRDPHRAIYASAAPRGLLALLRMWPRVREQVEDARLEVCYDLGLLRHPKTPKHLRGLADTVEEQTDELEEMGVTFWGGLAHDGYLGLAARCGVWAYPTIFPEVYCIVAAEMQALGLIPVTTDKGALDTMVLAGSVMPWRDLAEELCLSDEQVDAGLIWDLEPGAASPTFANMIVKAMEERPVRVRGRALVSGVSSPAPGLQQDESGTVASPAGAGWSAQERLKLSRLAVGSYDWARTSGATDRALSEHREKDPWPRPQPHRDLGSPRSPRSPSPSRRRRR